MDIIIPVTQTVVSSKCELRIPYCCEHCGFQSVARVVGRGTATTQAQLAILPSPYPSQREVEEARSNATADGNEMLALVDCPRCGKKNSAHWARYMRMTRIMQAAAAAVFVAIIALMIIQTPADAAIGVIIAFPGTFAVLLLGYLRGLHAEVPANRVTFLSPEYLAAEAEQAAKVAAKEAAEDAAKEEARRARAKRRRMRAEQSSEN